MFENHINLLNFKKKKTEVAAVVPKSISKLFELRLLISLRSLRFDFNKRIDRSFDNLDDHPNVSGYLHLNDCFLDTQPICCILALPLLNFSIFSHFPIQQMNDFQVYKLNYNSVRDCGRLSLLQCVGKRIDKVTLFNCYGKKLVEIGKHLNSFEFRRLEVSCEQLTKDTAYVKLNSKLN